MKALRLMLMACAMVLVAITAGYSQTDATTKGGNVTYTDVAPIFSKHCMSCHRPGEIAPMSLLTYEETRPWARSIKKEVSHHTMPPWHADPRKSHPFRNEARLTDEEVQKIVTWVDSGALRGNPKELPPPPKFIDGWQLATKLGPPDIVLSMKDEFAIPASGEDLNLSFEIPTTFTRDYWVIASEVRGNPRVVHHNTASVRWPDGTRDRTGRLSSAVPGKMYDLFGPEAAKLVKAGSTIVFGIHYHPSGQVEKDRSVIGLWFAKKPFTWQVYSSVVADPNLAIPPGDPNYLSGGTYVFAEDSEITAMKPHMHYRGKDMEYKVIYPDGREEVLLAVPNYDMNWQTNYELIKPVFVPKGTKLVVTAHFNNSPANPWNPDPTIEVRWGDDSRDEMMEGWFDFRRKLDKPVDPASLKTASSGGN